VFRAVFDHAGSRFVLLAHEHAAGPEQAKNADRKLLRDVARGGEAEPFRPRASSLDPWLDRLNAEWSEGCRNTAPSCRVDCGGGLSGVVACRDRAGGPKAPRALARLLTSARDRLTRAEALIVATAERPAPDIVAARELVDAFQALIRKRGGDGLEAWIDAALTSPVASFAKGVAADRAAVFAAIQQPWSNG
jgi:hypothetical protein